jgi:hypothetical protein
MSSLAGALIPPYNSGHAHPHIDIPPANSISDVEMQPPDPELTLKTDPLEQQDEEMDDLFGNDEEPRLAG